ncbi:hypothetical protein [Saccharopolyspora spinosa]|uniref:hypothetical protein n=1 Tax=Saccharopolyspora spinosa TaxID=60894 RepID=UPI000237A4BF|nr:hypothetical protein [Saccharopolyspora spinosa]
MKRTLTAAAAVLVGGAGAVGFAAAANAAEIPQLPAELPTDSNLAQTTYHVAGTLASAQQAVGDVVPVEKQLTGRSNAGGPLDGVLGGVGVLGDSNPVTGLLGGVTGGKSLDTAALPVGDVVPAVAVSPVARHGGPVNELPAGLGSVLDSTQVGAPQTKPAQLPPAPQEVNLVGETVHGVVAGSPVASTLPAARSGSAGRCDRHPPGRQGRPGHDAAVGKVAPDTTLDKVNDVASHGPLGGVNQLGG